MREKVRYKDGVRNILAGVLSGLPSIFSFFKGQRYLRWPLYFNIGRFRHLFHTHASHSRSSSDHGSSVSPDSITGRTRAFGTLVKRGMAYKIWPRSRVFSTMVGSANTCWIVVRNVYIRSRNSM